MKSVRSVELIRSEKLESSMSSRRANGSEGLLRCFNSGNFKRSALVRHVKVLVIVVEVEVVRVRRVPSSLGVSLV